MDGQTIGAVFVMSVMLTIVAFGLHGRLAGGGERPGPVSMAAFVLGWLSALTALTTGAFLMLVLVWR